MRRVERLLLIFSMTGLLLGRPSLLFTQSVMQIAIRFADSLQANPQSYFVYPVLELQGLVDDVGPIEISLKAPPGWRLLSESFAVPKLQKDSLLRIPVTLMRGRGALASWASARIWVTDSLHNCLTDTFLLVKAYPKSEFAISTNKQDFEIDLAAEKLAFPLTISNRGSLSGYYEIAARNTQLRLEPLKPIYLLPGQDSTIQVEVKLSSAVGEGDQRLVLYVEDSEKSSRSIPISFHRVYNLMRVHPGPYKTFPLSIEWGSLLVDQKVYQFVDARADIPLKTGALGISFRTKTLGAMNTIEKNQLTVNWKHLKWNYTFGQLTEIKHFYAYGRGIRAVWQGEKGKMVGFSGIIHANSLVYSNDNFSSFLQYDSRLLRIMHRLSFDFDAKRGLNGYLLYNELSLRNTEKTQLKFNFSTGWEEFKKIAVFSNNDMALGVGYSFSAKKGAHEFYSSWQYHQKSYPGVDKGLRNHYHSLKWKPRKDAWELFYQFNSTTSSVFLDTIYLSDYFHFNMEKMGLKWSHGTEKSTIAFSTGLYKQAGISAAQLPRYQFMEFTYTVRFSTNSRLALSSLSGYADNNMIDKVVYLTNSNLDWQYHRFGLKGFYVQQPVLRDSSIRKLQHYSRTVMLSPYMNFRLFARMAGTLRFSISKSLYDDQITSNTGFSVTYQNRTGDWQVQAGGTIPIYRSKAPNLTGYSFPYVSLSVKKQFQFPSFFKRRYHTLSVQAFEDLDLNGQLDPADRPLSGIRIHVNDHRFITNEKGDIRLLNTDTGLYHISVQPAMQYKGLVPLEKSINVHLQQTKNLVIPFRRGHAIFGKVDADLDPYSSIKFTKDNILVKITDSVGKQYQVLTDKRGEYFLNIPAGIYTVSLNPAAFTGPIRPDQLTFTADLREKAEMEVNFMLRQRRREIRIRNQ